MKCSNCGAELDANALFCTTCGTKVTPGVATPAASPTPTAFTPVGMPNQQMPNQQMPNQQMPNQQMPNQQMPNQQMPNQQMPNQQMPNQQMPNQQMPNQQMPPMMNQQPGQQFSQMPGQNPYQQMNPVGMGPMGMNPYGAPMQPPKAPRKPLSKGAKIGIICGVAGAALLVVFLLVFLPMITGNKLKGKYCNTSDSSEYAIFDDGTYVAYEDDDVVDAGTYKIDGSEVILTNLEGDSVTITYNKKKNQLVSRGGVLKCKDKKATLDYKLTESYLDDLKDRITEIAEAAATDEDMYDELYWGLYIDYEDLEDPDDGFEEELSKGLNYENDPALQEFFESEYLYAYIEITYSGDLEVEIYVY